MTWHMTWRMTWRGHGEAMAQDVAQKVAEDVFSATEDGSVKVLILLIVIFQRRNPRLSHACRPPTLALGLHVKDKHVKDAAQGAAGNVTQDLAEGVLGAAEDGSMKVFR